MKYRPVIAGLGLICMGAFGAGAGDPANPAVAGAAVTAAARPPAGATAAEASWICERRTLKDFMYAKRLLMPLQEKEKVFYPRDRRANFTFFNGVKDVRVESNALCFTVTGPKAVLGWGNYLNQQPKQDIQEMWPEEDEVVLRVRQSGATNSDWQVKCWSDGERMAVHSWFVPTRVSRLALKGEAWQELAFKPWRRGSNNNTPPDGLEFEVEAPAGTQISLEYVKLVQPQHAGYSRKEFTLPENAKVWRALADAGAANGTYSHCFRHITELYVNGKPVRLGQPLSRVDPVSVDLKQYLRPGKNCLAIHSVSCQRFDTTTVFLQGRIILDSGETVTIDTDATWKIAPESQPGWNEVGFNDASWGKPEVAPLFSPSFESSVRAGRSFASFPADLGCLVVKNPFKSDLFYRPDQDLKLEILAPPGFAVRAPVLEYAIETVDRSGDTSLLTRGTRDALAQDAQAIRFMITNSPLAPGVYALSVRLLGKDGGCLAQHLQEPLVVIPTHQPAVAGRDYTEGLDLELEDRIECANPQDPHPWMESEGETADGVPGEIREARVIKNGDLTYREGSARAYSTITWRLPPLKHPGDFYLMELEYPDDADREIEVSLENIVNSNAVYTSSAGAACGGRYYRTGTKQTMRWIQVADQGVQLLQIANPAPKNMLFKGAAVCSLKVYHIRNGLPSVDNPATGRLFGVQMERTDLGSGGYGWAFSVARPDLSATNVAQALPWKGYLAEAVCLYETSARVARYLKFAGQNVHCLGAYQYDPFNTPMVRAFQYDTGRILPCAKTYLANMLDANGIAFYANVEFLNEYFSTFTGNAQVAQGDDTAWFVNREGRQLPGPLQNWIHPGVRQGFLNVMADIAGRFGGLKQFRGVQVFLGGRNLFWGFGPTDYESEDSVDDRAFGQFKKDMNVNDLIDDQDPERFQKRASLLQNAEFARKYYAWRSRQGYALLAAGLQQLRHAKPDANLLCPALAWSGFWKYYLGQDRPLGDFMQRFAVDPELYKTDAGLALGPVLTSWSHYEGLAHRNPYYWIPAQEEAALAAFRGDKENLAFILLTNDEGATFTPGSKWSWVGQLIRSDWIVNTHKSWKNPQPSGFSVRENFISAMIGLDPATVTFGFADGGYPLGFDQPLRKFALMYTRLPRDPFKTALDTGCATDLVIRTLAKDGESWLYVINPGYWYTDAKLDLDGAGDLVCPVPWQTYTVAGKAGARQLSVRLEPFDLVVFKTKGPLSVKAYAVGPVSDREIAHMTQIADAIEALLRDERTRVAVTGDERAFLNTTLAGARQALAAKRHALAWSKLGHWRVWLLWKMYLEKAAQAAAILPPEIRCAEKTMKAGLPVLKVPRTAKPPAIDGKPDDPCWQVMPYSAGFVSPEGKPTLAETGVKMLYDKDNLYLAFICADPEPGKVKANATDEKNLFQCGDDVLSIFLQPDEKNLLYYQLAFNTRGARFDQRVVGRIANFPKEFYDYTSDWKAVSALSGRYWTSEVAIPFSALDLKGPDDTAWRINFHRVFRERMADQAAWAKTGTFHCPETAGRLEFMK